MELLHGPYFMKYHASALSLSTQYMTARTTRSATAEIARVGGG